MAKGYHNLAGLCRDLRNALRDASEGSATAQELVDNFDELLELLYDGSSGDIPGGQEGDESASGEDADDESDDVDCVPRETGEVRAVGVRGQGPAVHSTRARAKLESRPSSRRSSAAIACDSGVPRAVPTARARNGGKR